MTASRRPSPLIVTADPALLDELLRLTAAAGVIADVAPDPAGARAWFVEAPLVLIGADAAEACARAGLSRPSKVVVVGQGDPPFEAAEELGASHVVTLPTAEPWIIQQLAKIDGVSRATVIAVIGGRGGAGASVLAGSLAVTGARIGRATLLIDADPLGGGLDLVLGWEHQDGLRWPALSGVGGRASSPALVDALPGRSDLVVLSWDRGEPTEASMDAMAAALDAGRRGRDLVVVDLPRHLDDAAAFALSAADAAYLVVPAELRACAAALRVAAAAVAYCPELQVVVRRPGPGGLRAVEVSQAVGLPLAGSFRVEPSISSALERGEAPTSRGRGSLARLCERLLTEPAAAVRAAA